MSNGPYHRQQYSRMVRTMLSNVARVRPVPNLRFPRSPTLCSTAGVRLPRLLMWVELRVQCTPDAGTACRWTAS